MLHNNLFDHLFIDTLFFARICTVWTTIQIRSPASLSWGFRNDNITAHQQGSSSFHIRLLVALLRKTFIKHPTRLNPRLTAQIQCQLLALNELDITILDRLPLPQIGLPDPDSEALPQFRRHAYYLRWTTHSNICFDVSVDEHKQGIVFRAIIRRKGRRML